MTIRVLIVDDQSMVRAGLRMLLSDQPDIEVVAEAGNGLEAVAHARRLRPDVVLMDIRMPELDGLEATRRILAADPSPRVLVLTTFDLDEYVYEALRAGASGFLLKDAGRERLVEAVRTVAAGESLFAPSVLRRLVDHYVARPPLGRAVGLDELSERELEVLRLIGRGLSNTEIGDELFISLATVKTHLHNIYKKIGVDSRYDLLARVRSGQ